MYKQLITLLILFPFFCFGQREIFPVPRSYDIISNECIALLKAGKLDSLNIPITFFKNYSNEIDSIRQFYIHTDTMRYSDSSFSVGKIILDKFMHFERRKIGEWISYYPSGEIYSKGTYSLGATTDCGPAGYQIGGYSFKTGAWKYWYDNGILMAEGNYEPTPVIIKNSCDSDTINVSKVTSKWNLFDIYGKKLTGGEEIISKINNSR